VKLVINGYNKFRVKIASVVFQWCRGFLQQRYLVTLSYFVLAAIVNKRLSNAVIDRDTVHVILIIIISIMMFDVHNNNNDDNTLI